MKQFTNTEIQAKKILKAASVVLMLFVSASCSQSKSNKSSTSTNVTINGKPVLASCSKAVSEKLSVNISAIKDQMGQADPHWIKLKFNVVQSSLISSGAYMRIFRMKANGSDAMLDQTALPAQIFDLTTGQPSTNLSQTLAASYFQSQVGLYVYLNDPQAQFQALKIAFYDASGKVTENFNILIPEFLASFVDYQTDTQGLPRSSFLKDLHPLKSTDTSTWPAHTFDQFFQQFCF